MATVIGTYYGPWVGPSANKQFRPAAQFQYTQTGDSGWYVQARYWLEVYNATDVYVWANITTSWAGLIGVSSSGNYGDTGWVDLGWIAYGASFEWNCNAHYYSSSYTLYESAVDPTSYEVPRPTYTVAYDANGGTGVPTSQTKTYGITLKLSETAPKKSGYAFLGWSTSKTATSAKYSAGGDYTENASVTLYAIWRKKITITYDANGGTGAPAAQSGYVYNSATSKNFELSTTAPKKDGHIFRGWSKSKTADSASYTGGKIYTFSANTTLYAVWEINTYPVTYDANGGTGAPAEQTKIYNATLKLSSVVPTRYGYAFLGWSTTATGSVAYHPGDNYTDNKAVKLYAIWQLIVYTVTFDATTNGGTVSEETRLVSHGNVIGDLPTAKRQYYKFIGWFTQPVDGTKIAADVAVTSDVTLYAQFVIDASLFEYVNGKWEPNIVFENVNGENKKVFAFEYVDGKWVQGIGG